MEAVVVIGVVMVWIVIIVLLVLASFGYGLKSRGFAADHNALTALPMSGITFKEYRDRRSEHPVTDEGLANRSKLLSYISVIALILLVIFVIVALFV